MLAMLTALTTPALTLLFLGVVVGLGAAFVWMFWELEQVKARHSRDRFAAAARRPRHNRHG
jgi:predicted negative regulator of RcsB-dependent stress response